MYQATYETNTHNSLARSFFRAHLPASLSVNAFYIQQMASEYSYIYIYIYGQWLLNAFDQEEKRRQQ